MKVWSDSFTDGGRIPPEFAFGVPDAASHVVFGLNRSPHLAWSGAPEAAASFAVTCIDPTAPSVGDDVNQEGKRVSASLPRTNFTHWIAVNLGPELRSIEAGTHSEGVTPRGKYGHNGPDGTRRGLNDYTAWFAKDAAMAGDYFGYDGPCPPWNDELEHRYVFTVYALDLHSVSCDGAFGTAEFFTAIEGHVLAQASITGTYTLNPALL